MKDSILFDRILYMAKCALDGLARRQEIVARNIANVDTPGYKALEVDFDHYLAQAVERHRRVRLDVRREGHIAGLDLAGIVPIRPRRTGSLRADGNNVDIDTELADLAEIGVRYQAVSQAASKKLLLLKEIATRR
ncbi:MAG TPA: flagellar basal body rod protein FlgB [Chloroflexi bacterium]|nr:flagellar basal body rod protein FlgB [Chloroflexota bacterium]